MKYPITPEYLSSAPDPLVNLFEDLEAEILKDICRRFRITGEATESAIAQIKILQERGADLKDIEKAIRKALGLSEKELDGIFDRAVKRNQEYYDELIYKANVVEAAPKDFSPVLDVIKRQTLGEFVNLTRSLGFAVRTGPTVEFLPIAETYQKILDDAAAQVMSGAFDYNTAVRNAVKRLTESGLQMVDYATGWHDRADVAARRAVMTGVSQLSSQYAEQAAETLHTNYREVTAHSGARDTGVKWQNHKSWQGKVYSVHSGDKYPSIYEVCGWGLVDGLEGANCRHHHFPYVEGISTRTYTDEELANIDPPPFEYQGKKYTAYEATQKQRQIERAMRKCKRDMIGYDAAGLKEDYTDSSIRLRRLSAEYKSFSKAAGLREQPERTRVATKNNNYLQKSVEITRERGIIESRNMALGMRKSPSYVLSAKEIEGILTDADEIGVDRSILAINNGKQTGFSEVSGRINIRGDVLPDLTSKIARDRMSPRAVLAHEYYGHYKNNPSEYDIGDWRDEFRASYDAAKNAPNLSAEDRAHLMIDAYDRAREAGVFLEYDSLARRIIYGK